MGKKNDDISEAEFLREYKKWEVEREQHLSDIQMMEDYLSALARQLRGKGEEEEEE